MLAYTARGQGKSTLLQGILEVTAVDSAGFAGNWSIHWAPGADSTMMVGPQVGIGTFHGLIRDGQAALDVSREGSAGLVRLFAVPDGREWRGRWFYLDGGVPRAGGTFTTVRDD